MPATNKSSEDENDTEAVGLALPTCCIKSKAFFPVSKRNLGFQEGFGGVFTGIFRKSAYMLTSLICSVIRIKIPPL